MYARIQQGGSTGSVRGALSGSVLHRLVGSDELVITLWATEAEAAADPTAEWYEVTAEHTGGAAAATPAIVAVMHFDGPRSPELVAAADTADRRIASMMSDHPGGVRVQMLWQPQRRSQVLLSYATSVDSLEQAQQKIRTMELWEDEDVALLPGPDRVDLYRVEPLNASVSS